MWIADIWKGLHKDFLPYADCKKHAHPFLHELKVGTWNIVDNEFLDRVRRKALSPFLFMESYPLPVFTLWARSSGLLPKEGYIQDGKVDAKTRGIINLVDGVAYHTALMLMLMVPVMGKCDYIKEIFHKEKRKCHDLSNCYDIGDTVKCLRNDDIFKIIRKCIPEQFSNKMVAAVVAISCVIFTESFESVVEEHVDFIEELNLNEEKLKDMGNTEFKEGDYTQAIASYTKIIKTRHYNSIIYNNRGLAFMKLGKWAEAEVDGHRAVVLKPARCKGYYCFVQAMEEQSFVHEAHAVAQFGLLKCDKSDCSNWKVLEDTRIRLSKKCETCAASKKSTANSNKKDSSSNFNGLPAQKNPRSSDVPDLVSDSESDNEREKSRQHVAKASDSSKCHSGLPSLDSLHSNLVKEWKAGSEALLDNRFLISIRHFQNSFTFIAFLKCQNYQIEEFEVVLINYSLAVAHYEIGGLEELKKAVTFLEDIINKHKDVRFPSAYYKLGSTFFKMNKFEEALIPLTNGLSIVEKGIVFTTHTWPGTDIKIEETQPDKLTDFLKELIEKCRYPPNPEAICRLESCSSAKNIFYSDPDFKGFCRVSCSESCHLEYHPHCWKLVKEKYNRKEKNFFGQTCLTPDCDSAISVIEIIDKDGLSKMFVCDATKQQEKQRKTKLEKKLEQKAKRRQKKRDEKVIKAQGSVENHEEDEDDENEEDASKDNVGTNTNSIHVNDKMEPVGSQESVDLIREKENISPNPMNQKLYEDNAEPMYVLKRETEDSTKFQPVESKQKQKKKTKKNIMSADEFCGDILPDAQFYNEYLNRVKKLQDDKDMVENGDENWASLCEDYQGRIPELDPQRPFYIPEDLRNNPETLESILQSYGRLNESEDVRDMRETIYSYMEDYLEEKGPMLKNNPLLHRKIQSFPNESQQLIANSGGLVTFLLESFRFAAVKNYICVMRDISKAYCLPSTGGIKQDSAYSLDGIDDLEMPKMKKEESPQKKYSEVLDTVPKKDNSKATTILMVENATDEINNAEDDLSNCNFSSSTIRKLNNTINRSSPASQFQLQVLLRSLNENQQNVLLLGALNSLMEVGATHEHLQSINRKLKGIIELRHPIKCLHKISQTDKVVISTGEVDIDVLLKLETFKLENKSLIERMTISEDTVVRLQNQHSVKLKSLEKEINELKEQLEEQRFLNATMEVEKEAESKRLQLEIKHAKQEQQIAQTHRLSKQLEEVTALLQTQTKETEKAMNLLEKERRSTSNLQDTLNCMLESGEDTTQRASKAEEGFLKMKKMCGLMKLDEAIKRSTDLLNKIEEEKRRCSPLLATVLNQHEAEGKKYLQELEIIKQEFLKFCKEQLEALKNGEQLSSLDFHLPKVTDPPASFHSLLSSPSFATGPLLPTPHPPPMYGPMIHGYPGPHGPMPPGMMYGPPQKYPPRFMSNIGPPGLAMNRPQMFVPTRPGSVHNEPDLGASFRMEAPTLPLKPVESLQSAEPLRGSLVEKVEPMEVEPLKLKNEPVKPKMTKAEVLLKSSSSGSLYNKLTPIPTTPYDTLCDIQLKVESPKSPAKSNPLGAISKMPNTCIPVITEPSLPLVPPVPPQPKKATGMSPKSKSLHNSYEKLISKLELRLPNFNPGYPDKFDAYIKAYRAKNNHKLTGKSMDEIVEGVAGIIEKDMMENVAKQPMIKIVGPKVNAVENCKDPIGYNPLQKQGPAWEQNATKKPLWKAEGDGEQSCCICFEEMSPSSVCKVECGHTFHSKCVKEWLKKDRTCPLCRVFILLPEEFPSLG